MSQVSASTMVEIMVRMQQQHNDEVHLQWRDQGFEYYRAIWVECAELLDHFGWKWWKKQAADIDQVKLEIVDIWHFGLSDLMRADLLDAAVSNQLAALPPGGEHDAEAFRQAVEMLAHTTLAKQAFELQPFLDVLVALPMDLDSLFGLYIGKNVLNNFRQRNGYKTGEYRKVWAGREDNVHLIEIIGTLADVNPEAVAEKLYQALESRYLQSV